MLVTYVIRCEDGDLYFSHQNGLTAKDKIAARAEARRQTDCIDVEIEAVLEGHVRLVV